MKISEFLSENFPCFVVIFSIYLNRHVFIMKSLDSLKTQLTEGPWATTLTRAQELIVMTPAKTGNGSLTIL